MAKHDALAELSAAAGLGAVVTRLPSLPTPPKRTAVPEHAARAFETAGEPKGTTRPKASPLRRESRGTRVAVYLPPELEAELRVRCARERRSISDLVTEAVARALRE